MKMLKSIRTFAASKNDTQKNHSKMENQNKIKVVQYFRVSTKRQGESGLGLEAQQSYLSHFLNNSNVEIIETFVEVASAKSMDKKKRPLLAAAIELCKKNGYILAVAKIDRLSRVTKEALQVFDDLNGRLFACDVPTKLGVQMDKFTLTIMMAVAERERYLIEIRTKQALAAKKERGEIVGTKEYETKQIKGTVLGTKQNLTSEAREQGQRAKKENADEDEQNQQAQSIAIDKRNLGYTLAQIADHLNKLGYRTRKRNKKNSDDSITTDVQCEYKPMTVKRLLDRVTA